jgi:hypothetical protein
VSVSLLLLLLLLACAKALLAVLSAPALVVLAVDAVLRSKSWSRCSALRCSKPVSSSPIPAKASELPLLAELAFLLLLLLLLLLSTLSPLLLLMLLLGFVCACA